MMSGTRSVYFLYVAGSVILERAIQYAGIGRLGAADYLMLVWRNDGHKVHTPRVCRRRRGRVGVDRHQVPADGRRLPSTWLDRTGRTEWGSVHLYAVPQPDGDEFASPAARRDVGRHRRP